MTTDQEKSATPLTNALKREWNAKESARNSTTSPEAHEIYDLAESLELANIQLREKYDYLAAKMLLVIEGENKTHAELSTATEQLAQEADIRADMESFIEMVSERLGVSQEPHQSFHDRLLNSCLEMGAMTKARDFEKEAHENTRVYLSAEIEKLKTSLVTKNEQLAAMTKLASDHREGRLAATEQLAIAQANNLTPCEINDISSRACERGQKCCVVKHSINHTALDEEIRKALVNGKTIRQMLRQATSWGRTYYNVINAVEWSEMQEGFINNLLTFNSLTPTSQQSEGENKCQ